MTSRLLSLAKLGFFALGPPLGSLAARLLLAPILGSGLAYVTFYPGIALAAHWGGVPAGVFATAFSGAAANWFFVEPRFNYALKSPSDLIGTALFLIVGLMITKIVDARAAALRRASASEKEALARAEEMETVLYAVPAAVWIAHDPEARRITRSWVGEELLRMSAGGDLSVITPVGENRKAMPIQRAARGEVVLGEEVQLELEDGSRQYLLGNALPLRDSKGRLRGSVGAFIDITERKRVEEALRKTQEKLTDVLESMKDGFVILDRDWRLTYLNGAIETAVGAPRDEFLGRVVWEAFPDLAGSDLEREATRAAQDRTSFEIERFSAAAGRWYSHRGFPTSDGGMAVFSRDITEKKTAESNEKFLLELEGACRSISGPDEIVRGTLRALGEHLDATHCFFSEIDSDSGIARIEQDWHRPGARSLTGAYSILEFRTAERLDSYQAGQLGVVPDVQTDSRTHASKFEALGVRSFVSTPCAQASRWSVASTVSSSEPRAWRKDEIALVRETAARVWPLIERARAIQALRESEERYRSLVAATTAIVWRTDDRGAFVEPQVAWEAYTGQSFEEHRGWNWAAAFHPEDRARVKALWSEAIERRGFYESSARLWHASSRTYRHTESRGVCILRSDGEVREWIGTCIDVEERFQAEEALRESDRRKDEFLATLSHELRNPLAPIQNSIDYLQVKGPPVPELQAARDVIDRQVKHLVRLVDDLLDVSRITRDHLELRKERVPLAAVVEAALEASRPHIQERRHELEIDLPGEALWVDADVVRLSQVLMNLLNNAARYTPDGGKIRLAARREGDWIAVRVQDNGIGLDPAGRERLFQLFYRGDGSRENRSGLGIGLALAERLIRLHGGTIETLSSGPGKGSEFVVRIPAADAPTETIAPPAPERRPTIAPCRVLVADDNLDSAQSLVMLLRLGGHEIRTARDGLEACELADSFRPDVAVLDIGMPRLDGYEAARRIRAQPWGKNVYLIALTGWGQGEDRKRAEEAGFSVHLTKPVDLDVMEKLLASISPGAEPDYQKSRSR